MKTEGSLTTRVIDSASSAVSTVKNAFVKPSGNLEKVQNLFITELRDRDSEFLLVAGSENTLRTGLLGLGPTKRETSLKTLWTLLDTLPVRWVMICLRCTTNGPLSQEVLDAGISV